jgi:hypothetical protein
VWRRLRRGFARAEIAVLEALRVHEGRWYPLLDGDPLARAAGVPFDISGHRFAAQAVVDGRVTHASRAALASLLDPDPEAVVEVGLLLEVEEEPDDARWVEALVRRQVGGDARLPGEEVARLLRALIRPDAVDAACSSLTRRDAQPHVDLWLDVLRRAPTPYAEVDPDHPLAAHVTDMLIGAVPPDQWGPELPWGGLSA